MLDPEARQRALAQVAKLDIPDHDLANSVHVTPNGALYYVCLRGELADHGHPIPEPEHGEAESDGDLLDQIANGFDYPGVSVEVPPSHTPVYHSRPGADRVIFLDFNGHVVKGTDWNEAFEVEEWDCGPAFTYYYSAEKTYSAAEIAMIRNIWWMVSQQFSTFDVDVTTEEPETMDSRTIHVLITPHRDLNNVLNPRADEATGVSFINVFGTGDYTVRTPVFVYTHGLSYKTIGNVAVHEIGHYLGLSHDGNATEEYYPGHKLPDSTEYWTSIMGRSYGSAIVQWSKGDYYGANNKEDDLQIISSKISALPGPGPDSMAQAAALQMYGKNVYQEGSLAHSTDVDWYSFQIGESGECIFDARPIYWSTTRCASLDILMELYDSSGTLVATEATDLPLNIRLSLSGMAPGTYYLKLAGATWGTPMTDPPTGYSGYGNRSRYLITGLIPDGSPNELYILDQPQPVTAICGTTAIFNFQAANYEQRLDFRWHYSTDDGQSWAPYVDELFDDSDYSLRLYGVTPEMDGTLYRCEVLIGSEWYLTDSAELTVITLDAPFPITEQPEDLYLTLPEQNSASLTYGVQDPQNERLQLIRWQYQDPGSTEWKPFTSYQNSSTTVDLVNITQEMDGRKFRCRVLNHMGLFFSEVATLHVQSRPEFIPVLTRYDLPAGSPAIFKTDFASGYPDNFSFNWEYKLNGSSTWTSVTEGGIFTGAQSANLEISSLDGAYANSQWRLRVTNTAGLSYSDIITVSMDPATSVPSLAKVAFGGYTGLYLRTDGSLWGAGTNSDQQLGDGLYWQFTPVQMEESGIVDCATSGSHTVYVKEDGTLWGLGSNESYRLGLEEYGVEVGQPVRIAPEFDDIIACAAQDSKTFFLRADQSLWAIGRYIEPNDMTPIPTPVKIADDAVYCSGSFYISSSGRLFQTSEPTYRYPRFEMPRTIDFIDTGMFRYFLNKDHQLRISRYNSTSEILMEGVAKIEQVRHGDSIWIFKTDDSLWRYDPVTEEFSQWATNVRRFYRGGYAALYLGEDNWVWGISREDGGMLGTGGIPNGEERHVPVEAKGDFVPPASPTHVGVTASESYHFVHWSRPKGASGFNVWRSNTANFQNAFKVARNITNTFFYDHGASHDLYPDANFTYWVEAVNGAGTSSPAGPATAAAIQQPTQLTAYMDGSRIVLEWEPAYLADEYIVWRSTSNDFATAAEIARIDYPRWNDEAVDVTVPQYYWVQAANAASTSEAVGGISHEYLEPPGNVSMELNTVVFNIRYDRPPTATTVWIYSSPTPNFSDASKVAENRYGGSYGVLYSHLNPIPFFWIQARYGSAASLPVPASLSSLMGPDGIKDYTTFKQRYFPKEVRGDPAISGPMADPDGDRRSNFEELIFYGDPLNADDSAEMPVFPDYWRNPRLPPPIPFRPGLKNVRYSIQFSSDLNSWGFINEADNKVIIVANQDQAVFLYRYSTHLVDQQFIRIVAERAGPLE